MVKVTAGPILLSAAVGTVQETAAAKSDKKAST
jgi:hypothetical protein